jgi:chromosome partitioning protein
MTVFAVANQKGGVGKTTTVLNLGAYLGAIGARVLLIDCDPQSNTTNGLAVRPDGGGLYDVLLNQVPAGNVIVPTPTKGVDVLPATPELVGAEVELLDDEDPNGRLKRVLAGVRDRYGYVLLDCPPSLGLLTLNALVAADAVLVPVQCEYLALEGLARLMHTLERVRVHHNQMLRIFGLVMTMYDGRTTLSHQVAQEVRRHYPNLTIHPGLRPSVARCRSVPSARHRGGFAPPTLFDEDRLG